MTLQSEHETYTVDRLEGGWAVLERSDGETFNLPLFFCPPDLEEGDVVVVEKMPILETLVEGSSTTLDITIDRVAARARLERAEALRSSLARAPEGDLEL